MLDLKVGDEVVLRQTNRFNTMYKLTQIERETKKLFVVKNGARFDKRTGIEYGASTYGYYDKIFEVDEDMLLLVAESKKQFLKSAIIELMGNLNHRDFSNEELNEIYTVLKRVRDRFLTTLTKENE